MDLVSRHTPVLLSEVLAGLDVKAGGFWLDGTLGLGGHAEAMLQKSGPQGRLLGLDRDREALKLAAQRLQPFGARAELRQGNFADMDTLTAGFLPAGCAGFDGILLDLGVSSMQLDEASRGFSFQQDGPLDMRMDPSSGQSAAEWIDRADEGEIRRTLFEYGEEPRAKAIARAMVRARPFRGTLQLAGVVEEAVGGRRGARIHPATRTFQALRLAVNQELPSLDKALPRALALLAPGGRLAVITFHSLEDRAVKEFIKTGARDCICPPGLPVCRCGHKATLKEVTRKPVIAAEAEIEANPRARSAKLRVAEKK